MSLIRRPQGGYQEVGGCKRKKVNMISNEITRFISRTGGAGTAATTGKQAAFGELDCWGYPIGDEDSDRLTYLPLRNNLT